MNQTAQPDRIRIVFLGTPEFSTPALRVLADDSRLEVLGVVTQPDRPAGRGKKLMPPAVRVCAESLGLPLFQTASIKKDEPLKAQLRAWAPDFLVTVAFGQILTREILDIPKIGTVNAHASLLPEFRGANPIQQAILQGKTETGITTMLTELGVDTGPILLKRAIPISPEETLGGLSEQLSLLAGPLLAETLIGMKTGSVQLQPQDNTRATHAPKCVKEDAILNWSEAADVLQLKIRAFNPAPGAATFFNGERIKLLQGRVQAPTPTAERLAEVYQDECPGAVLSVTDGGIRVRTGKGILELLRLQPAGKREMSARDWALGALKSVVALQDGQPACVFTGAPEPTHAQ